MLPHETLPGDQRRVHRQERGRAVRSARSTQGALQRVRVRKGCTHLAAHREADVRNAVAECEQELRTASRVHLCAGRVHAAPERAGHRAPLRRHQPAPASVLLPEAALPGRADQLLRSPGTGRDMSSLDRILPFLKPIEDLLVDPAITEVMVNGGGQRIFVERRGCIEQVSDRTLEVRNLTVAIKNIARACGDEISERQPMLDARLEDGSRVAAMIATCAVDGPTLTVRKFTHRFTHDDVIAVATLRAQMADVLRAAVEKSHNILISGGTGTGKTTLLNAVAQRSEERRVGKECRSRWSPAQ